MNYSIIRRTLGWILLFEAIFFLVPLVTAIVYWEDAFFSFLIAMIICGLLGWACIAKRPQNNSIYAKEGFVIVALSWITLSVFGALPFVFSGSIPNFIDALFETVSGFSTTGATIISTGEALEAMPRSILMWRSFTHWIGGMGVLVFLLAFLPLSGARNMHIMKAESPGPVVSKLVPKVRSTAFILYGIYTIMTAIEFILLLVADMPVFEALNTAFATAGTGGFALKGDSFAGYSSAIQIIVTVFMLLFSINFNSYYMLGKGRWKEVLTEEVKVFLLIVFSAIALITLNVYFTESIHYNYSFGETLKHTAFSVSSIISTTGFATANFDLWPELSKAILVTLMFIGACAGSTGGGIKVSRIMILAKGGGNELHRMLHPKQIKKVTIDKKVVDHEVVRTVNAYLMVYMLLFITSLLVVSLDGASFTTNFTAVTATINNIGPGLEAVGPAGNFAFYSWWAKLVFIFDMLAGRLELFPMLLLFAPATWRK